MDSQDKILTRNLKEGGIVSNRQKISRKTLGRRRLGQKGRKERNGRGEKKSGWNLLKKKAGTPSALRNQEAFRFARKEQSGVTRVWGETGSEGEKGRRPENKRWPAELSRSGKKKRKIETEFGSPGRRERISNKKRRGI